MKGMRRGIHTFKVNKNDSQWAVANGSINYLKKQKWKDFSENSIQSLDIYKCGSNQAKVDSLLLL
jgi:hypothetical protein